MIKITNNPSFIYSIIIFSSFSLSSCRNNKPRTPPPTKETTTITKEIDGAKMWSPLPDANITKIKITNSQPNAIVYLNDRRKGKTDKNGYSLLIDPNSEKTNTKISIKVKNEKAELTCSYNHIKDMTIHCSGKMRLACESNGKNICLK